MKKITFILFFTIFALSACATKDLPSSAKTDKAKLLISGEEMMCLSEEEEECIEAAENKCFGSGYTIIREEVEDNTFEDDKYILTFKCK